ncbi:MAG: DUF512 domain-containing protein [Firmicutes bacterium]|nr:DUF512 domain-containing protein [Bacillota bacterium]
MTARDPDTGVEIKGVAGGSIAEELGLAPGDRLLAINGQPVEDLIDYKFLSSDEEITLSVRKADGKPWSFDIEKDYDADLGLSFDEVVFGGIRRCANRCLFCFVDQMPAGMRSSLYVKDDDYRLSFWQGNFVTLTNLTDQDLDRIRRLRLSPLYVSIHTTDPRLRAGLLRNPRARGLMEQLSALGKAGIQIHAQIVLCPGFNDGPALERTVHDLAAIWPQVQSVAVVPVGLTGHREGLAPLRSLTGEEASALLTRLAGWRKEFQKRLGTRFVYASDEIYLTSGAPIPPREAYEELPQTENGVGLARLFLDDFNAAMDSFPKRLAVPRKFLLVTGVLGEKVINSLVARLNQAENLAIDLCVVENRFFGGGVTVTGLLTGADMIRGVNDHLRRRPSGFDAVLVPEIIFRSGGGITLDDFTPQALEDAVGLPVRVAPMQPEEFLDLLATE